MGERFKTASAYASGEAQQRAHERLKRMLDEAFSNRNSVVELVKKVRGVASLSEAVGLVVERLSTEPYVLSNQDIDFLSDKLYDMPDVAHRNELLRKLNLLRNEA